MRRLLATKASDYEIAAVLTQSREFGDVAHDAVRRDRLAIEAEWKAERLHKLDLIKGRELAELDAIEREAAVAFATSKDPAYLAVRLKAKERRAKLLGLDAPQDMRALVAGHVQVEPATPTIDYSKLSDDQLEALVEATRVVEATLAAAAQGVVGLPPREHGGGP